MTESVVFGEQDIGEVAPRKPTVPVTRMRAFSSNVHCSFRTYISTISTRKQRGEIVDRLSQGRRRAPANSCAGYIAGRPTLR